jgi:cell division protein ZapA
MAQMVDLTIAGRTYQVACREGEEENLRAAARLVDGKSREALAGLGTVSEARQFLFASLLLADQLVDTKPDAAAAALPPADTQDALPAARPDPALILRAESLAERLESLAMALENEGSNP